MPQTIMNPVPPSPLHRRAAPTTAVGQLDDVRLALTLLDQPEQLLPLRVVLPLDELERCRYSLLGLRGGEHRVI